LHYLYPVVGVLLWFVALVDVAVEVAVAVQSHVVADVVVADAVVEAVVVDVVYQYVNVVHDHAAAAEIESWSMDWVEVDHW